MEKIDIQITAEEIMRGAELLPDTPTDTYKREEIGEANYFPLGTFFEREAGIDNYFYILASAHPHSFCLINLDTGARMSDSMQGLENSKVSEASLKSYIATRGYTLFKDIYPVKTPTIRFEPVQTRRFTKDTYFRR